MAENALPMKEYFSKHRGVAAAYIFGSTVSGRGWKKAPDIDVAVLFDNSMRETLIEGERIREKLEKISGRKVDVVSLNDSPPLMKFEVIKNGKLLFEKDKDARVEFEVRSLSEFYDLEPLRRHFVEEIGRLIREGKF